jgi:DNA-binding beta-propeller fold protein YncE
MSRSFLHAAFLASAWLPLALPGQAVSTDFGNWLQTTGASFAAYQSKPCIPSVFPFSVSSDTNSVSGYGGCMPGGSGGPGGGSGGSGSPITTAYLASIIPTPGLTSSSVCGTTGVRCAADASKSASGQGEALNQIARMKGYGPKAGGSVPRQQLPTFRMLPFPPVFPNQSSITPPEPACGPGNEYMVMQVEHGNSQVGLLGACSSTVIMNIPVTSRPLEIKLLLDGTQAIVTSYDNAITFIDVASNTVVATIQTPFAINPSGIAVSPDGTRAYVTDYNDPGNLLIIDVQKHQILQTVPLGPGYPQSVFVTRDGSLAWVTFPFDNKIAVVDTLTNTIVKTLGADSPFGVAFNSTGTLAYVSSRSVNAIEVFNTTTYASLPRIPVGIGPTEMGIAPDDAFAVVTNFDGNSLTIINLSNNTTNTIPIPASPEGLDIRSSN